MQLISRIEVNYFRSIYNMDLKSIKDLNVFVGGNDAGKSNILRALNLFFNNQTDLNKPYEFSQDITKFRVQEAQKAKGRVTLWTKIYFNNIDNWKSLPKTFFVKKSWDRNGAVTLTSSQGMKQRDLSRFLNKVIFHYVPAIRSRNIFSHYLGLMHDCLLDDTKAGLSEASKTLTFSINKAVNEMSENIFEQLGFESKIEVPQNFRDLFQALDFSTAYGDFQVPLVNRGDGIQARHLPHILDFITKQDSRHHLWGYEEPENSLEMANAFKLADLFEKNFSKQNQVFLTTHSPAFYDLSSARTSRWLISSEAYKETDQTSSVATLSLSKDKQTDERLGIAEFLKDRSKELYLEKETLEKNLSLLSKKIESLQKPLIVTEGKFDVLILNEAWKKLYPKQETPFDISSCNISDSELNEEAGVKQLSLFLDATLPQTNNIIIGIFDNDGAGKRYYENLKKYTPKQNSKNIKAHNHASSYALLLPNLPEDGNHWATKNVCIEFLFPKIYLTSDFVEKVYIGIDNKKAESKQKVELEKLGHSAIENLGFKIDYEIKKKKILATKIVPTFPKDAFQNFDGLFEEIKNIIV